MFSTQVNKRKMFSGNVNNNKPKPTLSLCVCVCVCVSVCQNKCLALTGQYLMKAYSSVSLNHLQENCVPKLSSNSIWGKTYWLNHQFSLNLFILFSVWMLCLHVHMCTVYVSCACGRQKRVLEPWNCSYRWLLNLYWCWELNSGTLQEHQLFLTPSHLSSPNE